MAAHVLVLENDPEHWKEYETKLKKKGFRVVRSVASAMTASESGAKVVACVVQTYQEAAAGLAIKPHVVVCDHKLGTDGQHGTDLVHQGADLVPQPLWLLVTGDRSIKGNPAYANRYDQTYLKGSGGIRDAVEDVTFFTTARPRGVIILPPRQDMPPCERVFVVSPTANLDGHWYFSKMAGLQEKMQRQRVHTVVVYRGSVQPLDEKQCRRPAFQALLRLKHLAIEGNGNVDLRRINTPRLNADGIIVGLLHQNTKKAGHNTNPAEPSSWRDGFPPTYVKVGLTGLISAFAKIGFGENGNIPTGFDPPSTNDDYFKEEELQKNTPKRRLSLARGSVWERCEFVCGDEIVDYDKWQETWAKVSRMSHSHLW